MFSKNMVLCKGNVGDSVVISVNLSVYFFRSFWNYFFCYLCYIPSINLFYTHTHTLSHSFSLTNAYSLSHFLSLYFLLVFLTSFTPSFPLFLSLSLFLPDNTLSVFFSSSLRHNRSVWFGVVIRVQSSCDWPTCHTLNICVLLFFLLLLLLLLSLNPSIDYLLALLLYDKHAYVKKCLKCRLERHNTI